VTFKTKPCFEGWKLPDMPPLSTFFSETSSHLYNIDFGLVLTDAIILSNRTDILEVLRDLHQLATFLNLSGETDLPSEAAYPDRLYNVEHRILCLITEEELVVNTGYDLHNIISLLLRVCLVYIYTNLRETPIGGKLRQRLVEQLQLFLERSNLPFYMAAFPAEILWSLFLGGFAATGTAYQNYFLEKIRVLCQENRHSTWDEICCYFHGLPVLEASCMQGCKKMWVENSN
jgi:hypothetical protein